MVSIWKRFLLFASLFICSLVYFIFIPSTRAINDSQIEQIARSITVKVAGNSKGSGVILKKDGSRYLVLTAKHVVAREDKYQIITPDNKNFPLDYSTVKKHPSLDLATIGFETDQEYATAAIGDGESINAEVPVFIAGFPGGAQYEFTKGKTLGKVAPPFSDGYAIVYTNSTKAGMSGGPVLDESGKLVGIHGRAGNGEEWTDPETGNPSKIKSDVKMGIPINSFNAEELKPSSEIKPTQILVSEITSAPPPATIPVKTIPTSEPEVKPQIKVDLSIKRSVDPNLYYRNVVKLASFVGHSGDVNSVAVSPSGKIIASSSADRSIKIWNFQGQILRNIRVVGSPSDVKITPNGQYVIASAGKVIDLYDIEQGRLAFSLRGHEGNIRKFAISPDTKYLATASLDKTIKIWDLATRKEIRTLTGHRDWVLAVTFTPDGQKVISSGGGKNNNIINIWDVNSGKLITSLTGHKDWINTLAITPDGNFLVSGSHDKTIKVWDFSQNKLVKTLEGHKGWVTTVAVSPDGNTIASGSYDSTIKLWNLKTGKLIETVAAQKAKNNSLPQRVLSVLFGLDGQTIVSSGEDNEVKIWVALQ